MFFVLTSQIFFLADSQSVPEMEVDTNGWKSTLRLLKSVLLVETELEGVIQRFHEKSDSSNESKSGEAGVCPAEE